MVPGEAMGQPPEDSAHHTSKDTNSPYPCENAHVPELVARVGLLVTRGSPKQFDTKEPVFDRSEIGVRLNDHYMLDIEAIRGLGPESEENETVEDGRHGKGKIPVAEKFGAKPQEKDTGDGGQEDVEGHCRVVQEAFLGGEGGRSFGRSHQ